MKGIDLKERIIKGLGLLAAIASGSAMILNGDSLNGIGIIAAALSSASLFKFG